MVFRVMTSPSDMVGYQCFGGSHCLHLHSEVNGARRGGIDMGREYKAG